MSKREGRVVRPDHVYCFVPSDDIDIVVLATYLKAFIDGTSTIKPSRHPRDKDELGYTIGASQALGRKQLEDLISDTHCWLKEQQSNEFLESSYDYHESDTWQRRKTKGPAASASIACPPVRPERRSASFIPDARKEHDFRDRSRSYGLNSTAQWNPHFRTSGCRCGTCDDCSAKEACNADLPSDTGFAQLTAITTVEHDIPLLYRPGLDCSERSDVMMLADIVACVELDHKSSVYPGEEASYQEERLRRHRRDVDRSPDLFFATPAVGGELFDNESFFNDDVQDDLYRSRGSDANLPWVPVARRQRSQHQLDDTSGSIGPGITGEVYRVGIDPSPGGSYGGYDRSGLNATLFALKSFKSSDSMVFRQEQDVFTRLSMSTSNDMYSSALSCALALALLPCLTATEDPPSNRTEAKNLMQKQRPLLRLNLQRSTIFAGAMTLNAVTVACSSQAMRDGSSGNLAILSAIGRFSSNQSPDLHLQQSVFHGYTIPPNAYFVGYAAFGVLLVYMVKQTPDHNYRDSVFFGSVVFGVMAVIADVYLGTPLQSSICRVMPIALLCGQLISLVRGKLAGKVTTLEDQRNEKVSDEKN